MKFCFIEKHSVGHFESRSARGTMESETVSVDSKLLQLNNFKDHTDNTSINISNCLYVSLKTFVPFEAL